MTNQSMLEQIGVTGKRFDSGTPGAAGAVVSTMHRPRLEREAGGVAESKKQEKSFREEEEQNHVNY